MSHMILKFACLWTFFQHPIALLLSKTLVSSIAGQGREISCRLFSGTEPSYKSSLQRQCFHTLIFTTLGLYFLFFLSAQLPCSACSLSHSGFFPSFIGVSYPSFVFWQGPALPCPSSLASHFTNLLSRPNFLFKAYCLQSSATEAADKPTYSCGKLTRWNISIWFLLET